MLDCEALGELVKFGCCDSCHDDINLGYYDEMLKITIDGKNYHVCCAATRALNDNEISYEDK